MTHTFRLAQAPPFLPWRAFRWYAGRPNLLGLAPVIVYQMAKVGSSAVVSALRDARLPVFHVHRMSADHLQAMRDTRRALGWQVPPVPAHDRLGLRLRRDVIDRGRKAVIVTLVRDPIARNISSYFEHLDAIWGTPNAHESISMERLHRAFLERFTHSEALTWFEDELQAVTGLDVYQTPFPSCGYSLIQHENLKVLILKTESSDETKARVLTDVLGKRISVLQRVNETRSKSKALAHRDFIRTLPLGEAYIREMLDSRYCTHFYSPVERDRMRKRYEAR